MNKRKYVIYGKKTHNSPMQIINIVECKHVERTKQLKDAKRLLDIDVYEVIGHMSATFWNTMNGTSVIYTREI